MEKQQLIDLAVEARHNAHAPYSHYFVGSALFGRTPNGDPVTAIGCNFENLSFGATICAERNALGSFVVQGGRELAAVVVASRDGVTPCGVCLQALFEFTSDPSQVAVVCVDESGGTRTFALKDLMPHAFVSNLNRTDATGE